MVISQGRGKKNFSNEKQRKWKKGDQNIENVKGSYFWTGKIFYNDNVIINQKDTYIIDKTGNDEKKILLFRFI